MPRGGASAGHDAPMPPTTARESLADRGTPKCRRADDSTKTALVPV
jgi:hypothetical protein